MAKTPPIVINDWETGGFSSNTNAVTEYAAIAIDGDTLEELGRYEAVIAPYDNDLLYDPVALEVTGMSMSLIKGGVPFKEFMKGKKAFLKKIAIYSGPKYKPIMAGHNIPFDINFSQQVFLKDGSKIQDYFACNQDHFGNYYPKYIDTFTLALMRWGNDETMTNHKLTDCVHKIGEEIVNAHRAMNDVEANTTLLINNIKQLRNLGATVAESIESTTGVRFRENFKF